MTTKRALITAILVLGALAFGMCGCSKTPTTTSTGVAPVSAPSTRLATASTGCNSGHRVLADLKQLSSGTSTSLSGSALDQFNTALSDLQSLKEDAPSTAIGSLATSIATSLQDLSSLAKTDPHGTLASTRERAQSYQSQYLTSAQKLSTAVTQTCGT